MLEATVLHGAVFVWTLTLAREHFQFIARFLASLPSSAIHHNNNKRNASLVK